MPVRLTDDPAADLGMRQAFSELLGVSVQNISLTTQVSDTISTGQRLFSHCTASFRQVHITYVGTLPDTDTILSSSLEMGNGECESTRLYTIESVADSAFTSNVHTERIVGIAKYCSYMILEDNVTYVCFRW